MTRGKNYESTYSKNGSELNDADLFGTVIIAIDDSSPVQDYNIVLATQFYTSAYPDVMYLLNALILALF